MKIILAEWHNKQVELFYRWLAGKRIVIKNPKYQKYNGRIVGLCDGNNFLIELDSEERGKPLHHYDDFDYRAEIAAGNLVVIYGWANDASKNYRLYEFIDMADNFREVIIVDDNDMSKEEIKVLIKKLEL